MTNTEMLLRKMKESGYKMFFIASKCNLSYPRLMDRVYNNTEFKASEILALTNLLNLTSEEREEIFFANNVGITSTT